MRTLFRNLSIVWTLLAGVVLNAQTKLGLDERLALIDSLSNPSLAQGSEVMSFEVLRIETGVLNEDSAASEYIYKWRNKGAKPVAITWVQTTCGCAVAVYDRKEVLPGGSSSLTVRYHPKGHPGDFLRRIFVYSNISSDRPSAILELSGRVTPSVLPTDDYPEAMGDLLLKRTCVSFDREASRQTERIECMNAGDRTLSIKALALPAGLSVEPLAIEPGAIADIVIRYNPSVSKVNAAEAPIFLEGLGLPPTKCKISVNFKL